ncbi:MAG: SUMF1/EgtB/PvdO family nonheme iron enzyme [Symploca sp. SIO3E6]|nr:SUMF1/EgtB/PvdO family nonheme iron enzyme [Caldora sp. SIO3E6]
MSLCLNPSCPHPQNRDNLRFCPACGSELLLEGRYRIIRQLGYGGFGKTYEVNDRNISKVLKVLINNDAKYVELFQREAAVLSKLNHPGIPKVERDGYFTFFPRDSQQPLHCLVMERIEGLDLEAYLEQSGNSPIGQKLALEWLTQLAEILEVVHSHNFFHRDIKPSNIMLKPDSDLALIDFGSAREVTSTYLGKQAVGQRITSIHSLGYAPPEQINGHAVKKSDFFALGRTFVYLLTAQDPSQLYDPYTDECQWRDRATHISPLLADFIDQLMAWLPGERPATPQVILQQLKHIEQLLYSPQVSPTVPSKPPTKFPPKQVFEFDVATLEEQRSGWFGRIVTWEVRLSRSQAEYFIDDLGNGVMLEMVAIPGGTFMMGSPDTDKRKSSDERSQHLVTVQPFYLGKFTVTQEQWRAVAALPRVSNDLDSEQSHFKGNNLPVERVFWYDAVEFCARISIQTGRTYRLPSEAEWEYACRAGTTTPFHFGKTITTDLANYDGNSVYGSGFKGEYRRKTTPVGNFKVANAFGLYDMHGNVWEWCQDHWHRNYDGAPTDGSAWLGGDDNDRCRLLRGGSWNSYPVKCRSACRSLYIPDFSHKVYIGFRVVCEAA